MATNPQGTVPGFNPDWYPTYPTNQIHARALRNFEKRRNAAEGLESTTRRSLRPAAPKTMKNYVKGGKRRSRRSRRRRASTSRRR